MLEPGHRVRNHHGRFHYDHVVALSRFSPFHLSHRSLCKRRRVHCDPASLLSASTTLLTASASPRFSFRKSGFLSSGKPPLTRRLSADFCRPNQHVVAALHGGAEQVGVAAVGELEFLAQLRRGESFWKPFCHWQAVSAR